MKVFQLVTGLGVAAGGPSYTIPALCRHLQSEFGVDLELNILEGDNDRDDMQIHIELHKRIFPEKLGVSPDMKKYLLEHVGAGDILHTHGLWRMPNIYPKSVSKQVGAKFVLSPRGMLSEWSLKQSRMLKKIMGILGQNNVILNADCIHVTAESECEDVRQFGYKGPIAIIPNGVDIPDKSKILIQGRKELRKLIFISRVHPKKGIEVLLDTWEKISSLHSRWELEICGPGDPSYIDKIKQKINDMPNCRVRYVSPVYGEEKGRFYESADLFILPTYSENFGVVVAEALSYNIPVIVSKGAPWQGVVLNNCGWWVDNTVDELEKVLNEALSLHSSELSTMGSRGRQWMKEEFSWTTIAKNMLCTYDWLNNKAEKPECIRLD